MTDSKEDSLPSWVIAGTFGLVILQVYVLYGLVKCKTFCPPLIDDLTRIHILFPVFFLPALGFVVGALFGAIFIKR